MAGSPIFTCIEIIYQLSYSNIPILSQRSVLVRQTLHQVIGLVSGGVYASIHPQGSYTSHAVQRRLPAGIETLPNGDKAIGYQWESEICSSLNRFIVNITPSPLVLSQVVHHQMQPDTIATPIFIGESVLTIFLHKSIQGTTSILACYGPLYLPH